MLAVVESLKKNKKEDLIKHFITHKFDQLIKESQNTRDLNAKAGAVRTEKNNIVGTNLKINFGRKDGFDVKGLFAVINKRKELKGIEVGTISLQVNHSVFTVESRRAEQVMKVLNGTSFRGKKVVVERGGEIVTNAISGGGGGRRRPIRSKGPRRDYKRKPRTYSKYKR